MNTFYLRWAGLGIIAIVLSGLIYFHYQENLASLTPQEVREMTPKKEIRVLGLVKAGTLTGKVTSGEAEFELLEGQTAIPVKYQGPPPDNLRELKTLILIGKWNPTNNIFEARDIGLVTNYGFVMSAYLIGLVPLAVFLFVMSRRVSLLYEEIKESKLYQAE